MLVQKTNTPTTSLITNATDATTARNRNVIVVGQVNRTGIHDIQVKINLPVRRSSIILGVDNRLRIQTMTHKRRPPTLNICVCGRFGFEFLRPLRRNLRDFIDLRVNFTISTTYRTFHLTEQSQEKRG